MKITRQQVLYQKADQIERQNHRGKPFIIHQKKPSRWRAGICSICGEYMTYISQDHAHRHGFDSADEMAKAGVMRWAERKKYVRPANGMRPIQGPAVTGIVIIVLITYPA